MISLRSSYRILRGESAQQQVVAAGSEAVFQTFNITVPEKKTAKLAEKEPVEEIVGEKPEIPLVSPSEALLQETMWKAEALLQAARDEAEEIKRKAYEEGFALGEMEGMEAGRAQALEEERTLTESRLRGLQEEIRQYVVDMGNQKDKVLEEYLDDLKDISLAIGEKIVQTSLKSSSEVVKKMIVAATEKLKKTAWAKIYVAQNNSEMDIQGDAQLLRELSKLSDNVKIVVMEDAEPGTCIIELPHEIIDISTNVQMENIRDILTNART